MILAFFIIFVAFCIGPSTDFAAFAQICLVALFLCFAMFLFSKKIFGYTLRTELLLYRLFPFLILYGGALTVAVIRANLAVLKKIFTPGQPEGVVVTFHSELQNGFANTLLANAITLTPGTITVHTEGDLFTVHCLYASYGKGLTDSSCARIVKKIDRMIGSSKDGKNPKEFSHD